MQKFFYFLIFFSILISSFVFLTLFKLDSIKNGQLSISEAIEIAKSPNEEKENFKKSIYISGKCSIFIALFLKDFILRH